MRFKDAAFYDQILRYVKRRDDKDISTLSIAANEWLRVSYENKVYYDCTWLGIPIIQTPSDMIIMQELLFRLRPRTLIETGVAHGGSLIFYSSILFLIHKNEYSVIGVDIDTVLYHFFPGSDQSRRCSAMLILEVVFHHSSPAATTKAFLTTRSRTDRRARNR